MKKFMLLLLTASALLSSAFRLADPNTGYQVGDIARDFSLKNIDGKWVSLSNYPKTKGYIVIFTCNHCPFSQAYEQRIIALHKKYAPKGFPVIAINPNDKNRSPEDSYENMISRAKEKQYPFVYLYDETQEIAKTYGATRTPHVFLLSKTKAGNKVEYIGAIDDNSEEPSEVKEAYLSNALEALLSGKKITTPKTKAIGCSIKWRKS